MKLSGTVAALSEVPSLMTDLVVDDDVDSTTNSVTEAHHAAGKYIVVVVIYYILIWAEPKWAPNTRETGSSFICCTLAKEAHYGMSAHPNFGLKFLLRSSVYSNMHPCVAALENTAQMAGL